MERQSARRVNATKNSQAEKAKDGEKLEKDLIKRIHDLNFLNRRKNVLNMAASGDDSLAIHGDEWDRDAYLLGCSNGVINLRPGKRQDGRPDDYILKASPTEWKGLDHPCKLWERFLLDIFDGNQDLCSYMKRLFGYAIS